MKTENFLCLSNKRMIKAIKRENESPYKRKAFPPTQTPSERLQKENSVPELSKGKLRHTYNQHSVGEFVTRKTRTIQTKSKASFRSRSRFHSALHRKILAGSRAIRATAEKLKLNDLQAFHSKSDFSFVPFGWEMAKHYWVRRDSIIKVHVS